MKFKHIRDQRFDLEPQPFCLAISSSTCLISLNSDLETLGYYLKSEVRSGFETDDDVTNSASVPELSPFTYYWHM